MQRPKTSTNTKKRSFDVKSINDIATSTSNATLKYCAEQCDEKPSKKGWVVSMGASDGTKNLRISCDGDEVLKLEITKGRIKVTEALGVIEDCLDMLISLEDSRP